MAEQDPTAGAGPSLPSYIARSYTACTSIPAWRDDQARSGKEAGACSLVDVLRRQCMCAADQDNQENDL